MKVQTIRFMGPWVAGAALLFLGACGTMGGGGYAVDYYDAGPVGYWGGFYRPTVYENGDVFVHPSHWEGARAGAPHIPVAPRPGGSGRGGGRSAPAGARDTRR